VLQITLSEDEKAILVSHYKKSNCRLTRERAHAFLLSSRGESPPSIAKTLFRAENTIRGWIKSFLEKRTSSIFTEYTGNTNAGKLTKEQRQETKKVLQQPPSEYGIPKEFWSVENLKTYIKAEFGIVYESDRSYHFILKFSNLSFKYPDTFDRRRNETQITERITEIHEEIKPFLTDSTWEVFASDEVRIQLEALIRRAWLKRGERTVVKVNREREFQNYIGLLNQKTFTCHMYEMPWQNQETVIEALKQFKTAYPDKKICIIWDNAKFHKGKLIRQELSKGRSLENFHLINLPPYAPDKNPIERVWNDAKGAIANIQHDTFAETKAAFIGRIDGRKFQYEM
jgi:transposase